MNEQQIVTVKQANNKERSFVSMINGERIEIPYSVKDFWFLLENRKGG